MGRPKFHLDNVKVTVEDISLVDKKRLADELCFRVEGAHFAQAYTNGHWDGKRHLFSTDTMSFPAGVLHLALPLMSEEPEIVDCRTVPPRTFDPCAVVDVKLRPYQVDAADVAIREGRGIIRAATGSGKSKLMADIIGRLGMKTLICVHITTLLWQLREEIEKSIGHAVGQIGVIGDGKFAPRSVTVAMIQSLYEKRQHPKVKEFLRSITCWITDEAHHLSADTMYDLSRKLPNAYYRFGLSATPWRSDGKDMLIHAATGPMIVDIPASVLIQQGYLSKPKIYFFPVPAVMGLNRYSYNAAYKVAICENQKRNRIIADAVRQMLEKSRTVLVAVNQINHGNALLKAIRAIAKDPSRVIFIRGENDTEEKTKALRDLNSHKIDCVVATTVFGEGVDIPNLDVLVNAKGNKSRVETLQVGGRALRKGPKKQSTVVIDFIDRTPQFFINNSKRRFETYLTEPEFSVMRVDGPGQIVSLTKKADLLKGMT
jgi:superfamily II DNA or RNA helicase